MNVFAKAFFSGLFVFGVFSLLLDAGVQLNLPGLTGEPVFLELPIALASILCVILLIRRPESIRHFIRTVFSTCCLFGSAMILVEAYVEQKGWLLAIILFVASFGVTARDHIHLFILWDDVPDHRSNPDVENPILS